MSNPWNIQTNQYDKTNSEGNVDTAGYGQISILLNKYVLKEKGKGLSSNDFTDNDVQKLNSIEVGAEVNKLETITINNGNKMLADSDKNINIPIPTKTSDLINDGGFAKLISSSKKSNYSDSYVAKSKVSFQDEESINLGKNSDVSKFGGIAIGKNTSTDEKHDINIGNLLLHNNKTNIWEGKVTEAEKALKNSNGTNLTELDNLIDKLSAEVQNRISADKTLQNNIESESKTRINKDDTLQSNIDKEKKDRVSADEQLQTSIDSESQARSNADSILSSNLDAEIQNRISECNILRNDINSEAQSRSSADDALSQRVSSVEGIIPSQANESNELADKAFVNSTIQTNTANFRGNWNTWSDVPSDVSLYPQDYEGDRIPTVNDYLVVQNPSDYPSDTLVGEWRFKYTSDWSTNGKNGWIPEYRVNEEPFTSEQWFAINSGITSTKVSSYDSHLNNKSNPHSVTKSQVGLGSVVNTGDSATPISGGTTKFTTGGAYTELNKKVDKVNGKGLSTNDFNNTYKNKLDDIDTSVTADSENLITSDAVSMAINTEVTNRNTAITNAINNLDVSSVGGNGKYISAISETNGKISATSTTMDTTPTTDSTNAVTSGGVKSAITTAETNAKNLANATGTLAISHGGTSATTANNAVTNLLGAMEEGLSDFSDTMDLVTSHPSGYNSTNNKFYKRKASLLWNYIKSKISSVLGLTETSYNGNSATATSATNSTNATYSTYLGTSSANYSKSSLDTALNGKVPNTRKVNGHALSADVTVTKSDVGLGNVSNTGDSATPISGGTTKFTTGGAYTELAKKVDKVDGMGLSSNDFTDSLKSKLDGIESGAQVNTVTGVKGSSETSYRTGDINITKSNIGLGSVVNTSDSATPISGGTTKFTTGGAYTELAKKVDKVNGKGLSTNDFTTVDKTAIRYYGTCATARNVVAKVVTCENFSLEKGCKIVVKFTDTTTTTPTSGDITLNINGTSAKNVYSKNNAKMTYSHNANFYNNAYCEFMYDGTNYVWLNFDSNTTYSTITQAEITAGTSTSSRLVTPKLLDDNFVKKESGKELSTNDFTNAYKSKLDGIESGAQVNTVTGVKGNSETTYRTGNINITKSNIGLGSVVNTGDSDTPISGGTTKFTTGGAYTELAKKVDKVDGKGLFSGNYNDLTNKPSTVMYCTCSTASATALKELVKVNNCELAIGTIIGVKFSASNSANNVQFTLDGGTTKYSIYYNNSVYTGNWNSIVGYANRILYYMFNGTYFVYQSDGLVQDGNSKVTQTVSSGDDEYEVLFSETADNTTRTEGARKNNNFKFNPSTGNLTVTTVNGFAFSIV